MELRKHKEAKEIERKLIRYAKRRVSDMPKIYKQAPTYAIHGTETLGVIEGLESKIKHN
ncbi:hypothetical protein ES703_69309 [subsurface metagenome]